MLQAIAREWLVDEDAQKRAHGNRDKNVEHRVLLDKDRGHADKKAERQHHKVQLFGPQPRRVEARKGQGRAADDVHAGNDVRVRVGGVDSLHQPDETVVLLEIRRAKVLPVREEHAEDDRAAEAEADVEHEALEGGRVGEDQVRRH